MPLLIPGTRPSDPLQQQSSGLDEAEAEMDFRVGFGGLSEPKGRGESGEGQSWVRSSPGHVGTAGTSRINPGTGTPSPANLS